MSAMFTRGALVWYRIVEPARRSTTIPRGYRRAFDGPARVVKQPGTVVWSTGYWASVRLLTDTGQTVRRRVRVTSLVPRLEEA